MISSTCFSSPLVVIIRALPRFVQKLLEQPAQFGRRALAAVAHDGSSDVVRAINPPLANRRAPRSRIALRAGRTALSLLAGSAALTLARDQLPAGTRAETRRVLERDEAAAVESDDVETTIACALIERLGRSPLRILTTSLSICRYASGRLYPYDIRPPASANSRNPYMTGNRRRATIAMMSAPFCIRRRRSRADANAAQYLPFVESLDHPPLASFRTASWTGRGGRVRSAPLRLR